MNDSLMLLFLVVIVLIGAGDLSRYMADMATGLGFEVFVCDPRPERAEAWTMPGVHVSREMPDDIVQRLQPDARTAVVALTHDPKLDDLALIDALQTSAFYVGAIGSRSNSDARRRRLREHFEVNCHYITVAALSALADEGKLPKEKVAEAIAKYGLQTEKINPLHA